MASSHFRFNRGDADYTPVFNEAVEIVDALLSNNMFLVQIVKPILAKYPIVDKFPIDTDIAAHLLEVMNSGYVVTKDAQKGTIIGISARDNVIQVNPTFLRCDEENFRERSRCLLLLAVKLLHAVFQGFTKSFYHLMGHDSSKKDANGTLACLYSTPAHIGSSIGSSGTIIGDNGFEFEEYRLRGRLTLCRHQMYATNLILLCPSNAVQECPTYVVPDELVSGALTVLRSKEHSEDELHHKLNLLPGHALKRAASSGQRQEKRRAPTRSCRASSAAKVARLDSSATVSKLHSTCTRTETAEADTHEEEGGYDLESLGPSIRRLLSSQSTGGWKE